MSRLQWRKSLFPRLGDALGRSSCDLTSLRLPLDGMRASKTKKLNKTSATSAPTCHCYYSRLSLPARTCIVSTFRASDLRLQLELRLMGGGGEGKVLFALLIAITGQIRSEYNVNWCDNAKSCKLISLVCLSIFNCRHLCTADRQLNGCFFVWCERVTRGWVSVGLLSLMAGWIYDGKGWEWFG
jgi:hypothetical protein